MRYALFYVLILVHLWQNSSGQPAQIGSKLPAFTLENVVNGNQHTFTSDAAAGKVLILEFWGTWCSPCIPALRHLDSLHTHFANDLLVVAVSDDTPERLRQFLTKVPVSVALASDPKNSLSKLFPHNTVPHTILVDKEQRIVAITEPGEISASTIDSLLQGKPVTLTQKQDAEFDPQKDYFAASPTEQSSVKTAPVMQGFPSFMRPGREGFKDRRVTFINVLPQMLFQYAYGYSSVQTKNELPPETTAFKPGNLICFDLIVPENEKDRLKERMRTELAQRFPIQASIVKSSAPVYVLSRDPSGPVLTPSTQVQEHSFNGNGLNATNADMGVLRDFVENNLRKPVVDETGLTGRYDFAVTVRQEDRKQSLTDALKKLGLLLTESQRDINFLVLAPR